MKLSFKTRTGCLIETSQVETEKDLFRAVARLQEIFSADHQCGCCESNDIQHRARIVDDNEYFELSCVSCTASLSFGQTKKGGSLFAKRKDPDGNVLPNRGWKTWKAATSANGLVSQPRKVSQ